MAKLSDANATVYATENVTGQDQNLVDSVENLFIIYEGCLLLIVVIGFLVGVYKLRGMK